MKYTTLNKISSHRPCADGWNKLLKHLGKTKADDELLPFEIILDSNGLDDALWCCRSSPEYAREWRLFAVWCARQVQHINTDPRVYAAIDAAENYANGQIDANELSAAWSAAESAVESAAESAAWSAARSAAGSAAGSIQSNVFRWVVNGGLTAFEKEPSP